MNKRNVIRNIGASTSVQAISIIELWVAVNTATFIFIYRRGSGISSTKKGKSGFTKILVKS